jgi:serine protease Do
MKKYFILTLITLALLIYGGRELYLLHQEHQQFRDEIVQLTKEQSGMERRLQKASGGAATVVDAQVVSSPWIGVQQQAKDAVVQLMVTNTKFNWLEPYKVPASGIASGTGFFISPDGDLVTNFHVVNGARNIEVMMPQQGQEPFEAVVVGVSPERDIALLKLKDESLKKARNHFGTLPYLTFGDSDSILRGEHVLALGFPLGTKTFKSTQGIISGREHFAGSPHGFIQTTAPINPGNSGGPSVNAHGKVIGINTANVPMAQNTGYIIPINEVEAALEDLKSVPLLRKPYLGGLFVPTSHDNVAYFGNPAGGGWYIADVFKNSLLERAGFEHEDMVYEVNGYRVDRFGEVSVPWSEDKVSVLELMNRFNIGDDMHFVVYRHGSKKDIRFKLELVNLPSVRMMFPDFEKIDYEIFGGMVMMNLTMNHVSMLLERASHLLTYTKNENQYEPAVIVTHVFANSQAQRSHLVSPGTIVTEINGQAVATLDDVRKIVAADAGDEYIRLRVNDRVIENMLVALPMQKIIAEESMLAQKNFYPQTNLVVQLQVKASARAAAAV